MLINHRMGLLKNKTHSRVLAVWFVILLSASTLTYTVLAWKPTTHVYFAEVVLQDVIDDGMVTIWATEYETGNLKLDSQGHPIPIGNYPVTPEVYTALKAYPAQFRAGTLGPDAYPDILIGQQVIHPEREDRPNKFTGSDAWLQYLFSRAFTGCNPNVRACGSADITPADITPANQAFVLGFLAHAAGDMYGHTWINHYTGGPFHFSPLPENATKHVVLEGYLGRRTPPLASYDARIDNGVDQFIYRTMVDATPRSYLDVFLLNDSQGSTSFPRFFSTLRSELQRNIENYYVTVNDFENRIDEKHSAAKNCNLGDPNCSAAILTSEALALEGELAVYRATKGSWITYQEAWRNDIDEGLRAYPMFSHNLALALFFNPAGVDVTRARQLVDDYEIDYVLSMLGAPDVVPEFLGLINDVIEALPFEKVQELVRQLKEDLLDYILKKVFGYTLDQIKGYLTNPELYFDTVMGVTLEGTGTPITLETLNEHLRLQDTAFNNPSEYFDVNIFPPAHNTITMIKLLVMSPDGINMLLADLGSDRTFDGTNAMLGFIQTLDGSEQWDANPNQMIIAQDPCAYQQIFMQQAGETPEPSCDDSRQQQTWPILTEGSSSFAALTLQYLLREHGAPIKADGAYGPGTRQAVLDFQAANGIPESGVVDATTWLRLVVPLERGAKGHAVRAAQVLLFGTNANPPVDGDFGRDTEQATRDFQVEAGLEATGVIDEETWRALLAAVS